MARIPAHGLGYGLLRWLAVDGQRLACEFEPQVSFNYLGQFGQQRELNAESPGPGEPRT